MILAFGKGGQVGTELARLGTVTLGRSDVDLSDAAACADAIRTRRPKFVVNAAAWTAVDRAEDHEAEATAINGDAPGAMARACADLGIPLVHISTDYVFDGTGELPWAPDDGIAPVNAYGRSKAAGEAAVRAAGGPHAILRVSWVVSAHGSNFVRTMLRLGADRDALNVVSDQVGGPTPARAIAGACIAIGGRLIDAPDLSGTYHFSGREDVSWADFARAIMDEAGLECSVSDIPTSEYPTPAPRPLNSRMECGTTHTAFGLDRPDWRAGLHDIIGELS